MYDPLLDTFLAVAELGSFTKAAELLYLSPTAVMKQMNTLEKRLESGEQVRRLLPDCRIALLCDEVADPDLAEQVMHARRFGRIDAFFYASVTANYLIAALEAL